MDNKELLTFFKLSKEERQGLIRKDLTHLFQNNVAYGKAHLLVLNNDGTVSAFGDNSFRQCNVSTWKDIKQIAAGDFFSVGLKKDGTVVAVGENIYGQCNVSMWSNISNVTVVNCMTIGFMQNGEFVVSSRDLESHFESATKPNSKLKKNEARTKQPSESANDRKESNDNGLFKYYVLSDGSAEIVSYVGKDRKVHIPEKIDGHKVSKIGNRAFSDSDIEEITIPVGITSIGQEAFEGCEYLMAIELPYSLKEIQLGAFYGCKLIKEINVPSGVSRIPIECFYGCDNLTRVNLTNSIKSIGKRAFWRCPKLKTIILPQPLNNYWSTCDAFESSTAVYEYL